MKTQKPQSVRTIIKVAIFGTYLFALFHPLYLNSQVSIVTERLRNDLINPSGTGALISNLNQSNSSAIAKINDNEVAESLKMLKSDGSWSDIVYSQTVNWQALKHLRRLEAICIAYNTPASSYYHKKDIKDKIRNSIEFYISAKPKSAGWWQNAIGAPIVIGPVLILMKTGDSFGFEQALLDSYADALLLDYTESAIKWPTSTTGANKTWLIRSSIYKSCIKNDEEALGSAFKTAFEEAKIITGSGEGIKIDNSFFQHGPQLYSAGYGRDFLLDITYFGILAHGTTWQTNESQLKLITDYVLDGYQWFCQRSAFDYGAVGREITRPGALSTASMKIIIDRLKAMNAPRTDELTKCYNFVDGKADFQCPGNKHFWKADIMVQHGATFYMSARIPSSRIIGTEKVSGENLKRKFLAWGSTNILVKGDEYWNVFPAWDWSRIPGVTTVKDDVDKEDPQANGSTVNTTKSADLVSSARFAGGVSNGIFGLAAYDYSWDGIRGRKAWFFTPEAMYCLGSGITATKSNPVITNVNQCKSSGTVTISSNGAISSFDDAEKVVPGLSWIHHDRVGYIFPSGGKITVKNMNQTGSWADISASGSPAPVTDKVFSIWLDHGNSPSDSKYEYIVVPDKDLSQFEKWSSNNPLKLISNTFEHQAVFDKKSAIFAIAFYRAGTIILDAGLAVLVNRPCLLLIQNTNKGAGYRISVSDPTTEVQNMVLKISRKLQGPGVTVNPDQSSSIDINMPSGENAGKSLTIEFINEQSSTSCGFENFKAETLPFFY
jgi:chondroitin AC lyase